MLIKDIPHIATYSSPGILKPDNETIQVDENGVLNIPEPPAALVAQSTGTDDEVEAMINDYYAGKLSLEDIKGVQSVGDIREANETDRVKMKIAAHYSFSGDATSSLPEQSTCKQVIIDFNHDTLVTSINNITKALITIQIYGTLGTSSGATAYGYMNASIATNTGGQASTDRRTQCNGNFYNALGFKSQVKQVVKQNCARYDSSTITTTNDYCFLCSEYEIFGSKTYAPGKEGTQYKYFETSSNRIKNRGQKGTGSADSWGERSVRNYYSGYFCAVSSNGESSSSHISDSNCIVPTCAL